MITFNAFAQASIRNPQIVELLRFSLNPKEDHPARKPFPNTSFGPHPSGVPRKPTIRADQLACASVHCRHGGTQSDLSQSLKTNDAQVKADASGNPSIAEHPVCTANQRFQPRLRNPTMRRHQHLPPSPTSTPPQEPKHASQQGETLFFNMRFPLITTRRTPQIS